MAIVWVDKRNRIGTEADVLVTARKNQTAVGFSFRGNVVKYKFKNAKRISIGFDNDTSRLYFMPDNEDFNGYNLCHYGKASNLIAVVRNEKFEGMVDSVSVFYGNYILEYDEEVKAYYIDYYQNIKFSKKEKR